MHLPRPAATLFGLALAMAAAPALLAGCGGDSRPSLVLVIMDTTRPDRLGCYGYEAAGTATLDSLAAGGVRFAQAVTAAPVTGPSITTILSGALPAVHGVRDNRRFAVNPDLPLLAEIFRAAGYRTGAVVGAVPLLARFGYDRGFESYDDRFAEDPYVTHDPFYADRAVDLRQSERRATYVTERALRWLDGLDRKRPFFLLVHYFDPHGPFDPPPRYARLHPTEPYDGEIAYMDAELGRLLAGVRERLGKGADVRVVAVADHGEGLFDHDEMAHGFFLYDTTVRVPLIVSGGGAGGGGSASTGAAAGAAAGNGADGGAGAVVAGQVRTLDVAPTICGWLDLPRPETFAGQDLSFLLAPGATAAATLPAACDTAYMETFWTQLHYSWSPLQGVRTERWKWIEAPRPELYDLTADPGETDDLAGARPEPRAELSGWLEAFLVRAADLRRRYGAVEAGVDPELDRKLSALGYVSGRQTESVEPDYDLPDPKDGNRDWNVEERRLQHVQAAERYLEHAEPAQALRRLEMARDLGPPTAREAALRGAALAQLGRPAEALSAYRSALARETDAGGRAALRLALVRILAAVGQRDEAKAQADSLRAEPEAPRELLGALEGMGF